jgi:ABC-type antimicrobial peptide transport system permease subunit
MVKHYLTVAFRNLWKYRLQNSLGIIGLSLGFLCFSIAVFDIEWRTGYDTEYPGAKRMYLLRKQYNSDYNGNIYNLNQALPEIEKIVVSHDYSRSCFMADTVNSQYHDFKLSECDTAFIDFFALKILAGNKHSINMTDNSVVLFDTKAREIDENIYSVIGKTVQNGDEKFQVTGIVKKPANSHVFSDWDDGFVINRETSAFRDEIYSKLKVTCDVYIMLHSSVSEKKFKETLSNRQFDFTINKDYLPIRQNEDGSYTQITATAEDERFIIKPLNDPFERNAISSYVETFLTGLLILLTTLFNYTSFQTSQFYSRLRECALRRAAGAGLKDLFFLFFTEIIIAFIAIYLVSIFLLNTFEGYINELFYLPNIEILRISMLKYLLFVLLIASVLYLIPVNIIHRMSIRTVFLGISQKGRKGTVRNAMMFFQMSVLFLFISAFAIVGLQTNNRRTLLFNHLSKEDRSNIVYTFCDGPELRQNRDAIINEIASSSFVAGTVPNERMASDGGTFHVDNDGLGIPNLGDKQIGGIAVHPDFFDFFRCKLIAGSFFTEDSPRNDVVIDENFASYYKDKSPIGETFGSSPKYRIAGVIKNLNTYKNTLVEFKSEKFPVFYHLDRNRENHYVLYVKSHKGKTKEVRQLLEETVKKFLPPQSRHTVYIHSFDRELEGHLYAENRLFRSMQLFFIISLVICLLGIYSAIVMSTEKRRKEIAIRKIHGATVKDVIILFGKTYVVLWTAACVLFFPVVYYFGNRWLEKYINRISLDITLFAGIYAVIMILVIFTIIFQILKVARCNPAEVIKKD